VGRVTAVATSTPAGDPFEALSDPNRRAIVELLSTEGKPVHELADALPISRPAVSRHLRLLKEAGLVNEERLGTRRIYRLQDQGIEAVQAYLASVWGDAVARFRLTAENITTDHGSVGTVQPRSTVGTSPSRPRKAGKRSGRS